MQRINQLTIDQISKSAPSALATQPSERVSDKYSFVSTLDAIMMIQGAGWIPYAADEAGVRVNAREGFQRHVIKFTRPDLMTKSAQERIDLCLFNSHDLSTAFMMCAGILRFVCTNGLVVGEGVLSFRHKHIGFSQAEFLANVNAIAESSNLISDKIDDFKTIEMSPKDINRYAWEAASLIDDDPKNVNLYDVTKARRYEDRANDLWTIYNRAQENIIKGGIRRAGRTESGRPRKDTRRVQSIARDLKINRQLWDLTEEKAIELQAA